MRRRHLLLVLLVGLGTLYFLFAQLGYWAPGYQVRLIFKINDAQVRIVNPFIVIDLSNYLSLTLHDKNDILVTDPTGAVLPFEVLDDNHIVVYARDTWLSDPIEERYNEIYVFLRNPDVNSANFTDLSGYYFSLTYYDVPSSCFDDWYKLVVSELGLDDGDAQVIWFLGPDGKFHGIAHSGDPDDGRSNRLYYWTYDTDWHFDVAQEITSFQLYGDYAWAIGDYTLDENSDTYYIGKLRVWEQTNGRHLSYDITSDGVSSISFPGKFVGVGDIGEYLRNGKLYPIITFTQVYTTSAPRLFVITKDGILLSSYYLRFVLGNQFLPIVNFDNGGGVVYYKGDYVAELIDASGGTSTIDDPPSDCGDPSMLYFLSSGVGVGMCHFVNNEIYADMPLPADPSPLWFSVGSCYCDAQGHCYDSPYADVPRNACIAPYSQMITSFIGLVTSLSNKNAIFLPSSFEPGKKYVICAGSATGSPFYTQTETVQIAFRFDDVDTAQWISATLISEEANDDTDPVVESVQVEQNGDVVLLHFFAHDDVALSNFEVTVSDVNGNEITTIPGEIIPRSDSISKVVPLTLTPGTEYLITVKVSDMAGHTDVKSVSFVPQENSSAGSSSSSTGSGTFGGGGTVSVSISSTEQTEATSTALSSVPVEEGLPVGIIPVLLLIIVLVYLLLRNVQF